jgi:hypothetical protein
MGDLIQDPGAVARARIATGGSTMGKSTEDFDPLADHIVGRRPTQIGYEA